MARLNMLLIHDWDYENYNSMTKEVDAWNKSKDFVLELSKQFNVYKLNLPGFCGQEEPKVNEWKLDNFVEYIDRYMGNNLLNIDVILGEAFGASIALKWKTKFKRKTKIILISPSLIKSENSTPNIVAPGFLKSLTNMFRNAYVVKFEQTPEMINGTTFLKNTYQNVTNLDLIGDAIKVLPTELCIIYGELDMNINPALVYNSLPMEHKGSIKIISGSDHMTKTHPKEVTSIIISYLGIK